MTKLSLNRLPEDRNLTLIETRKKPFGVFDVWADMENNRIYYTRNHVILVNAELTQDRRIIRACLSFLVCGYVAAMAQNEQETA